jgi:hypothetical protein
MGDQSAVMAVPSLRMVVAITSSAVQLELWAEEVAGDIVEDSCGRPDEVNVLPEPPALKALLSVGTLRGAEARLFHTNNPRAAEARLVHDDPRAAEALPFHDNVHAAA